VLLQLPDDVLEATGLRARTHEEADLDGTAGAYGARDLDDLEVPFRPAAVCDDDGTDRTRHLRVDRGRGGGERQCGERAPERSSELHGVPRASARSKVKESEV
jgi:hypothetical protein